MIAVRPEMQMLDIAQAEPGASIIFTKRITAVDHLNPQNRSVNLLIPTVYGYHNISL